MESLSLRQLTGQDEQHLVVLPDGHRLQAPVAAALSELQQAARADGFELAVASSFRSFDRQRQIWNAKACGERAVHDDAGCVVDMQCLDPAAKMHAILRYSALPGASRHHWGTDLDVFDAAAVGEDYVVQLAPQEVAPGGVFDALHSWLDERMASGQSCGFFRPYAIDRGGVAPERWHLSYAPIAQRLGDALSAAVLRECWQALPAEQALLFQEQVEDELEALFERYIAVPNDGWAGECALQASVP